MASIDVDTAALHAAAGSISRIAERFAIGAAPGLTVSSAQATVAAVNEVHAATAAAKSTLAARLRSAATAIATSGSSFAMTERASTEEITALAPGEA